MTDRGTSVIGLCLLSGRRAGWNIAALVTDVSPGQVCALVDGEVPLGTLVSLEPCSGERLLGIVQAVEPVGDHDRALVIRTRRLTTPDDGGEGEWAGRRYAGSGTRYRLGLADGVSECVGAPPA